MKLFCTVFFLIFTLNTFAEKSDPKEWTMLLYLNGNNNLDSYGFLNLNQMEMIGSDDNVNMVVQWASIQNGDVRRLLVKKDEQPSLVTSPILENMGQVDMGDAGNLEKFIEWGMEQFPARKYFVVVWNHGSGWHQLLKNGADSIHLNDISWDDNTGHSISTSQLGAVMKNASAKLGRKIDIYGSDACLMAMAEIAGEMNGSIDYFLGSQELEPGAGWPYDKFLSRLRDKPTMSPAELSKALTEEYVISYQNGSNGNAEVTFSAFDMAHYNGFVSSMNQFGSSIRSSSKEVLSKLKDAVVNTQSFFYSDYGDLGDLLSIIDNQKIALSQDSLAEIKTNLKNFILANGVTSGYSRATGLSIWLPKYSSAYTRNVDLYKGLKFQQSTDWADSISSYLQ